VTVHRLLALGSQYAGFRSSPPFTDAKAKATAQIALKSGADIISATEMGSAACSRFAHHLGGHWSYHRAQGTASEEGINGLFWDERAFANPEGQIHDWNLRSHGQWQRTFLLVYLVERGHPDLFVRAGTTHLAATGQPLNRQGANAAKWDQVHQVRELIGGKRVLVGMDFPRTDDDDDIAWAKKAGLEFHGRTDKTPMVTVSRGAVYVTGTSLVGDGGVLDHLPNLTTFTLTSQLPTAV
jgi:hypothetical protein